MAAVDPLPLVPAIWTVRYRRCGSPSRARARADAIQPQLDAQRAGRDVQPRQQVGVTRRA